MIYVILSFIALLLAIAFCVSFIMYIQDRRRQRSVQDTARRHTLEIPSYEQSVSIQGSHRRTLFTRHSKIRWVKPRDNTVL